MSFMFSKNLINAQIVLHTLKKDTENIISHIKEIETDNLTPKTINDLMNLKAIENSLSQISIGLDDTELMITFSKFIELLEAENIKLQLSLKRQTEETCWLREELVKYQKLAEKYQAENVILRDKLEQVTFQQKIDGITDQISAIPIENDIANISRTVKYSDTDMLISNIKKKVVNPTMAQSVFSFSSRNNTNGACHNSKLTQGSNLSSDQASPSTNSMLGSISSNASSMLPNKFRKLQTLVSQYSSEGKYDISSSLCLQTIKDLEKNSDSSDPIVQSEIASVLNILAIVYKDQNKFDEAAEVLKQVLDIREKSLDPFHPMVAASLNNLSILYAKACRFAEAEPLCLRALTIREKILGKDHIDVAKQLNNLALLYQGQNKNEEIEYCFERSLEIFSLSEVSSDSNQVLKAKNSLASAKFKLNKLEESERLVKEILTPKNTNNLPIWKSIESKTVEDSALPLLSFHQWTLNSQIDPNLVRLASKTLIAIYQKRNMIREAIFLSDWLQTAKTDQSSSILSDRNVTSKPFTSNDEIASKSFNKPSQQLKNPPPFAFKQ